MKKYFLRLARNNETLYNRAIDFRIVSISEGSLSLLTEKSFITSTAEDLSADLDGGKYSTASMTKKKFGLQIQMEIRRVMTVNV